MQPRKELRHLFEMEWSRAKHWIVDEAFMEFVADHGWRNPSCNGRAISLSDRAAIPHEKLANPGFAGGFPGHRRPNGALAEDAAALDH